MSESHKGNALLQHLRKTIHYATILERIIS